MPQARRETLLALMHFVHTESLLGAPLTTARMRWMLGFQRRRLRRWECEMLFPNPGDLPQISHTEAITAPRVANALRRPGPQLP